MNRRGFTLVEMLVATGIFVIGFTALYTMFLIGVRNRVQAEAITATSLVADAVVARLRSEAAIVPAAAPSLYIGDGDADNGAEGASPCAADDLFFAYVDQPGVFYRVMNATDLLGTDGVDADALRLDLLVGQLGIPQTQVSVEDLQRRYGIGPLAPDLAIAELERRHLLRRYDAVVLRQATR
jgi:prepilin-type N-terminal cleavage/methylation domain-containing protein